MLLINCHLSLTKAQLRVLEEIDADLEKVKPMNRLLTRGCWLW